MYILSGPFKEVLREGVKGSVVIKYTEFLDHDAYIRDSDSLTSQSISENPHSLLALATSLRLLLVMLGAHGNVCS